MPNWVALLRGINVSGQKPVPMERCEIYLYCPDGYGKTKLSNSAFEKKLSVVATTRNWKTTTMLCEMAVE